MPPEEPLAQTSASSEPSIGRVAALIAAWVFGAIAVSFGALFLVGYAADRRLVVTVAFLVGGLVLVTCLFMIRQAGVSARLRDDAAALSALRRRVAAVERLAITGELAARVAHEIKNPLAPIKGYAQMLQAKLESVAPADRPLFEKGLGIIRCEVEDIDSRIRSLLKTARPSSDQARKPTFDVNRVLRESIALLEGLPLAPEMVTSFERELPAVVGDADGIRSALVNVLANAIDATLEMGVDQRGRVELTSLFEPSGRLLEGPVVVIEVKDQGVGLADLEPDQLFRVFYTTKTEGTGLGLAIARTAIEGAGGAIDLRAREDRRGAVVRIELHPV
ncbi:MAG: hypothetical protein IPK13_27105 [Deltaproteobacteria bacterium]|nr:hypothetical protein [Deltaproteobacteria bacterium]